ncbi:MAG: MATE family efflux transporter [Gammaproteobacteria bacterium]
MEVERRQRILSLALPIIGGMVSQNVLNLVDTAMVGTLGDAALAAVGLGGFVIFMSMALLLGVGAGVQATAARRVGEGRHERSAVPLNAGLLICVIVGPLLSAGLYFSLPAWFPLLNADPEVYEQGLPYLQWRVLGIVFVGINFAFRGYWNAIDRSMLYMQTIIVMHVVNIVLNYVFIFGHFGAPALGAGGAGLASAVSTVVGAGMYIFLGWRYARGGGFLQGLPGREEVMTLARLSLPTSMQQFFFAAGFTAMYWIIGRIGTAELAAASVLVTIMLVALLPGMGFGMAATTLVSQALGRGDADAASVWAWDVVKLAVVALVLLGVPMWLVPDLVMTPFIENADTRDIARMPLRLVGLFMAVEAIGLVLMNALLGAGDARRVMLVSIGVQWFAFLPLAWLIGPVFGFGLLGVWSLNLLYRGCVAAVYVVFWRRRAWAQIKL